MSANVLSNGRVTDAAGPPAGKGRQVRSAVPTALVSKTGCSEAGGLRKLFNVLKQQLERKEL